VATYKLIQDIEADDKILGPLTLRQFIYALTSALLYYVCFVIISKHIVYLLALFLPPALLTSFFAFPFRRDQPTEVWALARLRFMLKPKRRIWSQDGVKDLVTITAPKKTEAPTPIRLTSDEVRSRLKILATTLDTRGWVTKNLSNVPENQQNNTYDSDRLISLGNIPKPIPEYSVNPEEDILDDLNPKSQYIANRISEKTETSRRALYAMLENLSRNDEIKPTNATNDRHIPQTVDEQSLSGALKTSLANSNLAISNLHAIPQQKAPPKSVSRVKLNTPTPSENIKFSYNPYMSVQTLAKEARENSEDGVVIKLNH
jgi:hypothetical protein